MAGGEATFPQNGSHSPLKLPSHPPKTFVLIESLFGSSGDLPLGKGKRRNSAKKEAAARNSWFRAALSFPGEAGERCFWRVVNGFSPIVQHCSAVKMCAPYALFRVVLSKYVVVLFYSILKI